VLRCTVDGWKKVLNGGAVRAVTDGRWVISKSPMGATLKTLLRGDRDIAVGAGGVVLKR
jgi:hypothetical protein